MELDKRSVAWYSTELGDWYAATGCYEILVGASSADIRLSKEVQVISSAILPLHVTRNTTISELLAHPKSNPVMMAFLDQVVQYMNGMQKAGDGENAYTVPAEQLIKMLESSPLRFMKSLMGMSMEQIDGLIVQLQGAIDA